MLRGRHRVGEAGATSASVNMRMYKTRMREFDGPLVKPTLELRHIFPENWLFKLENVTSSARTRYSALVSMRRFVLFSILPSVNLFIFAFILYIFKMNKTEFRPVS